MSYKNVCFLSSLLYRSLWLYHKTKLNSACQPPPCRHTWPHMAGGLAPSHPGLLQRTQRSLPPSSPGPSTLPLLSTYLICSGSLLLSPPFRSWVEARASSAERLVFCLLCASPGHSLHVPLRDSQRGRRTAAEVRPTGTTLPPSCGPRAELEREAATGALLIPCHR